MSEKSKKNKSPAEGAYRFGEFQLYPSERKQERRHRALPLPLKSSTHCCCSCETPSTSFDATS
jgi:hypothetical protein